MTRAQPVNYAMICEVQFGPGSGSRASSHFVRVGVGKNQLILITGRSVLY